MSDSRLGCGGLPRGLPPFATLRPRTALRPPLTLALVLTSLAVPAGAAGALLATVPLVTAPARVVVGELPAPVGAAALALVPVPAARLPLLLHAQRPAVHLDHRLDRGLRRLGAFKLHKRVSTGGFVARRGVSGRIWSPLGGPDGHGGDRADLSEGGLDGRLVRGLWDVADEHGGDRVVRQLLVGGLVRRGGIGGGRNRGFGGSRGLGLGRRVGSLGRSRRAHLRGDGRVRRGTLRFLRVRLRFDDGGGRLLDDVGGGGGSRVYVRSRRVHPRLQLLQGHRARGSRRRGGCRRWGLGCLHGCRHSCVRGDGGDALVTTQEPNQIVEDVVPPFLRREHERLRERPAIDRAVGDGARHHHHDATPDGVRRIHRAYLTPLAPVAELVETGVDPSLRSNRLVTHGVCARQRWHAHAADVQRAPVVVELVQFIERRGHDGVVLLNKDVSDHRRRSGRRG
mmetsp:Transcript_4991/g.22507  ORF Transcript_4991/g.22507 Transcript_4991/m.22507 type:complete len:454 (+) Transcript_4991:189-1550(+)